MSGEIEIGYCQCGCGGKTRIAKQTDARDGYVKGQSVRFIRGHNQRKPGINYEVLPPTKPHICECGCGRATKIATKTNSRYGIIKGQPLRFVNGHNMKTHGLTDTPEHLAYMGAKNRCQNPKAKYYERYGGGGITFGFTSSGGGPPGVV